MSIRPTVRGDTKKAHRFRPKWRIAIIALVATFFVIAGANAALANKSAHTTFSVYLRRGPSPSVTPALGVVSGGAPIVIYCQTPTTDAYPTSVAGHGTSWLWDLVSANVGGVYTRGYMTDLAADNTPYQTRDPNLPDCANLGGLELDSYCQSIAGLTHAALDSSRGAYGWKCVNSYGWMLTWLDDVQMTRACTSQYGGPGDGGWLRFIAYHASASPYSWRCAVKGSNQ
jgi:hypothetical protein